MLDQILREPAQTVTLCVLAHCDDETIVCGGLLARLAEAGGRVFVQVLCGASSERRREFAQACGHLGVEYEALDYVDATLSEAQFPELVGVASETIRREKPDLIVTHDPEFDYNPDHRLLGRCVAHGAQKAGMHREGHRSGLIVSGEVHVPIPYPDYLVDVTAQMGKVMAAMQCHVSQLTEPHKRDFYNRLIETRGRWRGTQAGCESALAFRRLPLPVIGNLYGRPQAI
ncbi:PIG-L family deacetylase [bacterium]|nr:PIG-L family deacetylase [bacterium]